MSARTLTNDEYAKLAAKLGTDAPDAASKLKQAHRLLCEGRNPDDLTPVEQEYARAFKGASCVQIPNDYGWEPGIEVEAEPDAETVKPAPSPKRKKNGGE